METHLDIADIIFALLFCETEFQIIRAILSLPSLMLDTTRLFKLLRNGISLIVFEVRGKEREP